MDHSLASTLGDDGRSRPDGPSLPFHFHGLLETLPAAAYVCDAEGQITYFNSRAAQIWGRRPALHSARDRFCGSVRLFDSDGEVVPHDRCWMALALRDRRAYEGCEITVETAEGRRIPVLAYVRPTFDRDGELLGAVNVVVDISDRKEIEESLRVANRRKDEFLALLGHELRNPLAPILSAAEYLGRADLTGDQHAARDVILRQSGQLKRLVDDLLDTARIAHGKLRVRRERVHLQEVVRAAVEVIEGEIAQRGHRLDVEVPEEPVLVVGDAARVSQAIQNLLANAARYTPPGGHVRLEVRRRRPDASAPGEVSIAVSDDGVGLADEEREFVFDPFFQGARDAGAGGLGVGLTLVRSIVEQHGGTVTARSPGPGEGSTFEIVLPALEHEDAPEEPVRRRTTVPRRVLVVDDNRDSAWSLDRLLSAEGHEVATAHCGHDALDVAESFRPDVVLLDLGLPDLDGTEVCRRLRLRPWASKAIVAAVTGWGQDGDKARTRAAGFDFHLTKPTALDALQAVLDEPLSRGSRSPRDSARG